VPVTGNPIVDWILTVLTAIGVVLGALVLLKTQAKKLSTANGTPFGNRIDDLRLLNQKHDATAEKVQEHETKIIVLENDQDTMEQSVTRLEGSFERHRMEQRETNRLMFSKLDEARDRQDEIKTLLVQIQQSNQG